MADIIDHIEPSKLIFVSWMEVEKACCKALAQHKSSKGYYRRARARKMLNRTDDAIKGDFGYRFYRLRRIVTFTDLRAVLKLQPNNMEAITELASVLPHTRLNEDNIPGSSSSSSKPQSNDNTEYINEVLDRLNIARPKQPKQPPFPRTRLDDKKLKITLMTVSASEYEELLRGDKSPDGGCSHKRKAKASLKEVDKHRVDAVMYPGWDRYIVKKAD